MEFLTMMLKSAANLVSDLDYDPRENVTYDENDPRPYGCQKCGGNYPRCSMSCTIRND